VPCAVRFRHLVLVPGIALLAELIAAYSRLDGAPFSRPSSHNRAIRRAGPEFTRRSAGSAT